VVSGAEGLLLYDRWPGLRDYRFANDDAYSPSHTVSNDASHASAYPTAHAAADEADTAASPATHSSPCTGRTSRSLQLRCWTVLFLGPGQAAVVLQFPPHLRPTDTTTSSSGSLQLC